MAERLHLDSSGTTEASVGIEAQLRILEEYNPRGWRRLCLNLLNGCPLAQANRKHFEKYCANRGVSYNTHSSCMGL